MWCVGEGIGSPPFLLPLEIITMDPKTLDFLTQLRNLLKEFNYKIRVDPTISYTYNGDCVYDVDVVDINDKYLLTLVDSEDLTADALDQIIDRENRRNG